MRMTMRELVILLFFIGSFVTACSDHEIGPPTHGEVGVAVAPVSIAGNNLTKAGPTTAVSGGSNTLGVLAPTADAAVARIANGLEGNAPATSGNFSRALAQLKTNLPKVPNINNATGYDQVQLLAYAACADLTTGGTPLMQSKYGVQANAQTTANQAALVAAGIRILDQHAASLASQGPGSAQVTSVFANLVQQQITDGATSKMAFMTVCIAASTAGSTLLGM